MLYLTRNVGEGVRIETLELLMTGVDHLNSEVFIDITNTEDGDVSKHALPVGGNSLVLLDGDLELHLESLSHRSCNAKFGLHAPNGHLDINKF